MLELLDAETRCTCKRALLSGATVACIRHTFETATPAAAAVNAWLELVWCVCRLLQVQPMYAAAVHQPAACMHYSRLDHWPVVSAQTHLARGRGRKSAIQ